jgi:hypothetical protein
MARDLDFKVRRTAGIPPAQPPQVATILPSNRKSGSNTLLWTVLILLFIAAAIGIWQFASSTTPSTTSIKTPVATKEVPPAKIPVVTKTDNSILSPETSSLVVQVYDSGAGSTAVDALIDKLKALGYKVDNLEKSQFNYDRTYIRYRAGMQTEAEKIQSSMPDRLVSLKEVQSAGLFDILILYGVK